MEQVKNKKDKKDAKVHKENIEETLNKKIKELEEKIVMKKNSAVFFMADEFKTVQKIAGAVRIELGNRLDLLEKNVYRLCYIVDFPMYELDERGNITFSHNPFSMPQGGLEALNTKNPLDVVAYQYDIVCNGIELSSGAVRNHDIDIMLKAFEIAGYTKDQVQETVPGTKG